MITTYRRFLPGGVCRRLDVAVSYTLIARFGTYSLVPFGYTLQHWVGAERNIYDRLVHFSFGLVWPTPCARPSFALPR